MIPPIARQREFKLFLIGIIQALTHELTHKRTEQHHRGEGEFTHDILFYEVQLKIIATQRVEELDSPELMKTHLEPLRDQPAPMGWKEALDVQLMH